MKTRIFFLSLLLFLVASSCTSLITQTELKPTTTIYTASIGDRCWLDVQIIYTFNSHEALATTNNIKRIKDIMAVKLITNEDSFYDGKTVSGYYIMTDTYSYLARDSTFKTVPVFIKASEYKKE